MELVGRITKDAVVNQLKDERKVVNFSMAVNDYYKPKNTEEGIKVTTFVNCSYWISTKITDRLTKGTLLEIHGRIYVNAYRGADGEAKASLNCHVYNIKIHSTGKHETTEVQEEESEISANKKHAVTDDLPF
ncbi:MAG: single-stranded DNA-binding protein [Bacteroidota bacterium]|nr:single-stranded DNA-binding protein [Bacteroidota bacterium]